MLRLGQAMEWNATEDLNQGVLQEVVVEGLAGQVDTGTMLSGGNSSTSGLLPQEMTFSEDTLVSVITYPCLFVVAAAGNLTVFITCLLYTSPSPRDVHKSRMPSSA